MENYYFGKLSALNYRIAIHSDNANIRLASEVDQILLLSAMRVPVQYEEKFNNLINLIRQSYEEAVKSGKGLRPYKIHGIRNKTAANYIKLLLDIQYTLEN